MRCRSHGSPTWWTTSNALVFLVIAGSPGFYDGIYRFTDHILVHLGFDESALDMMTNGFNLALFGRPD